MTIKQLDNPTPTQTPMRFTFRPQLQMIFWFKIPPPQILPSFFTIYSIGDITKMSKTWRKILPMPTPFTVGAHAIFFSFPYFWPLIGWYMAVYIISNAKNLHFCYLSSKYRLSSCPLYFWKWPWNDLEVNLKSFFINCRRTNLPAPKYSRQGSVLLNSIFQSYCTFKISVQKMCQKTCVTHYLSHFYSVNIFWLTILINNPINGYFWLLLQVYDFKEKVIIRLNFGNFTIFHQDEFYSNLCSWEK